MPEAEKIPQRLGRLITSPKAYAKQKTLLAGLRWLRANLPLGRVESEGFDLFWVVTRHANICEIIRQHDLFHNGDRASTLVSPASDDMARTMRQPTPSSIDRMAERELAMPRLLRGS